MAKAFMADALLVDVRDQNVVRSKARHVVIGVDTDGVKHVLGLWLPQQEGVRFWNQVLGELRNRGVRDVVITCCDRLVRLSEAIEPISPQTVVQTSAHGDSLDHSRGDRRVEGLSLWTFRRRRHGRVVMVTARAVPRWRTSCSVIA